MVHVEKGSFLVDRMVYYMYVNGAEGAGRVLRLFSWVIEEMR